MIRSITGSTRQGTHTVPALRCAPQSRLRVHVRGLSVSTITPPLSNRQSCGTGTVYDNRQTVMGNRKKQLNGWDHETRLLIIINRQGFVMTITAPGSNTYYSYSSLGSLLTTLLLRSNRLLTGQEAITGSHSRHATASPRDP